MTQESRAGHCLDDLSRVPFEPAAVHAHRIEAVVAAIAERFEVGPQPIEAEPVQRGIARILDELRTSGDCQSFVITLERPGIPAIERKLEFLLAGAELVAGRE